MLWEAANASRDGNSKKLIFNLNCGRHEREDMTGKTKALGLEIKNPCMKFKVSKSLRTLVFNCYGGFNLFSKSRIMSFLQVKASFKPVKLRKKNAATTVLTRK